MYGIGNFFDGEGVEIGSMSRTKETEQHLLDLVRIRQPEALTTLVHTYLGQVLRAAQIASLDLNLAEDLTQATFTTFIEKADQFEGRSHIRTWLFGILYNKISEARRKKEREIQIESIEELVERRFSRGGKWMQPPRPVDLQFYDGEVRVILQDCLRAVPAQQRMAFVLREVEGLSTTEICEILGVTRTNLGSILCRVRNRLRECLEARGVRK